MGAGAPDVEISPFFPKQNNQSKKNNKITQNEIHIKQKKDKNEIKNHKKTGFLSPGVLPWGNARGNRLEAGTIRWRRESQELHSLR